MYNNVKCIIMIEEGLHFVLSNGKAPFLKSGSEKAPIAEHLVRQFGPVRRILRSGLWFSRTSDGGECGRNFWAVSALLLVTEMLLVLLFILLLGGEGVKGRQGIGGIQRSEDSLNFEEDDISSADVVGTRGPGLLPMPATSLWLARTWALALLTFCTLGILLCLLILYYVVVKMREGTLVGNQTMGLLLLLSVLLLFLSVPPWLVPPSHTVCALRHSAHLLALALCLGVLLVKVVSKLIHTCIS